MSEKIDDTCDEKIFQGLHEQHAEDLYNFLYYKYGQKNNPGDLVQEAFLKLWDNCKKVLPEKARSFLFTVANNSMLNQISRQKTVITYHSQHQYTDENNETPEFIIRHNEFDDRLQDALNSLTEDQRVTFLLNRVEGKKHKEIAEMLGISKKAVEKRIYTTLAILKEKLEEL